MKFAVNLVEEDQIQLEDVQAAVIDDGTIEFAIEGTISDIGSGTLEPFRGSDVRPISITFETVS